MITSPVRKSDGTCIFTNVESPAGFPEKFCNVPARVCVRFCDAAPERRVAPAFVGLIVRDAVSTDFVVAVLVPDVARFATEREDAALVDERFVETREDMLRDGLTVDVFEV